MSSINGAFLNTELIEEDSPLDLTRAITIPPCMSLGPAQTRSWGGCMHGGCVDSNKSLRGEVHGNVCKTIYTFLHSVVVQDPPQKIAGMWINLDWPDGRTTQAMAKYAVC